MRLADIVPYQYATTIECHVCGAPVAYTLEHGTYLCRFHAQQYLGEIDFTTALLSRDILNSDGFTILKRPVGWAVVDKSKHGALGNVTTFQTPQAVISYFRDVLEIDIEQLFKNGEVV